MKYVKPGGKGTIKADEIQICPPPKFILCGEDDYVVLRVLLKCPGDCVKEGIREIEPCSVRMKVCFTF